jgi:hypothetical protein
MTAAKEKRGAEAPRKLGRGEQALMNQARWCGTLALAIHSGAVSEVAMLLTPASSVSVITQAAQKEAMRTVMVLLMVVFRGAVCCDG